MRLRPNAALSAAALIGAFALAGCVGSGSTKTSVGETTPPKTGPVTSGLAGVTPSTAEIYGSAASAAAAQARPQTSAVPPPGAPAAVDDPKKLVGLDRTQLEALLGLPAMQRREGAAELWQYRAANCVLDLFLYAAPDGRVRATHADLRARRDNRAPPQGCFAEIAGGSAGRAQTARN